ncbi:MAG: hypothetical protein AAF618_11875 [Pseudomonadota bacterium]
MKHLLHAGTALVALTAGMAHAGGHLTFAPGEGPFSWDSYDAWAADAPDLSGQTVTIAGPWLNPEDDFFRNALAYFTDATGAEAIYTGAEPASASMTICCSKLSEPV